MSSVRVPFARALVMGLAALLLGSCAGQRPGRVVVLGLDGVDPDVVELLLSEGRLPNFARLRREGAHGRLRADPPLLSPILWTTIATGRNPTDHGIGHFVAEDQATGESLPVTSRMRKVPALWSLVSEASREVAVVGWWATWPAEPVRGSVVSDHVCYHFLFEDGFDGPPPESVGNTWPRELEAEIAPLVRRPRDVGLDELAPFARVEAAELDRPFDFKDDLQHLRWALSTAQSYQAIGLELWRERQPDLTKVYVEGVDSISHLFGHVFRVEGLSGDLAVQHERFGNAVEAAYDLADRLVGEWLDAIDEDTTLVVLSDHGFQLGRLHDDPRRAHDLRRVSEAYHDPEGILYLHGRGVRPGSRIESPHQLDVAPTLLALLGLPAARTMPGRVLAEALTLDSWPEPVDDHGSSPDRRSGGSDAAVDAEILERLQSLGYVGTTSPSSDRNLAHALFLEGRHAEAEAAYRELLRAEPDDPSLIASLAGALGELGRYEEALTQVDRAVALAPLRPEPRHNRGVLLERQGRLDDAVAAYREAVRYAPSYEPSRDALLRLTGSPEGQAATSEQDQKAVALAELARQHALRGDYARASVALDEAERLAPDLALVHQHRSNVAFLSGDHEGAIRALERALEIEPDNVLYRTNLDRLRATDRTP